MAGLYLSALPTISSLTSSPFLLLNTSISFSSLASSSSSVPIYTLRVQGTRSRSFFPLYAKRMSVLSLLINFLSSSSTPARRSPGPTSSPPPAGRTPPRMTRMAVPTATAHASSRARPSSRRAPSACSSPSASRSRRRQKARTSSATCARSASRLRTHATPCVGPSFLAFHRR